MAACNRGVVLIKTLVEEQSLNVVQYYMKAIMLTAERAVRDLLRHVSKKFGGKPLEAVDWLDDGTALVLKITIDEESGDAEFDFTGTSAQVYGNLNTPTAILYSGIIYVLRSLIVSDLPLNQGCLTPIKVERLSHLLAVLIPGYRAPRIAAGAQRRGGSLRWERRVESARDGRHLQGLPSLRCQPRWLQQVRLVSHAQLC